MYLVQWWKCGAHSVQYRAHIPDYALERITERFYSLPRESGVKSTGLGLNFVEQVAKLHSGTLEIANVEGGVKVTLQLPTP